MRVVDAYEFKKIVSFIKKEVINTYKNTIVVSKIDIRV